MLRNPRVTIVPLPLYFYIPNFGGIVLSAKQLRIMQSLCAGIADAYSEYKKAATDYQMEQWSQKFKWFFVKWAFRKLKYLQSDQDINAAKSYFTNLKKIGALENPKTKWAADLCASIDDFIK